MPSGTECFRKYTVLPWEDGAEYDALIEALAAEHSPQGPTEEHLVEELAGIIWRKRRLRLAESAAHHRALKRTTDPYRETAQPRLFTRPPVTQAKMKAGPWMTRSALPTNRRQRTERISNTTKP